MIQRTHWLNVLYRLFVASILASILWVINTIYYKPFSINLFFERVFVEYGMDHPEIMSRFKILDRFGIDYYNNLLNDISIEGNQARLRQMIIRNSDLLHSYKPSSLNENQKLSAEILEKYFENEILRNFVADHEPVINHISGIQVELPKFMINVHEIHDLEDAETYLERLSKFKNKFEQLESVADSQDVSGVVAPDFIIDKVIEQSKMFITPNIKLNPIYHDFTYKIKKCRNLNEVAREELTLEVKGIIEDELYPAYQNLISFLESKKTTSRKEASIANLPKGVEYYMTMLKINTTTDSTSDEFHHIGEHEVSSISRKIMLIADSLGYNPQNREQTGKFLRDLYEKKEHFYSDDSIGYAECIKDAQYYTEKAQKYLKDIVPNYPIEKIIVTKLPPEKENDSPLIFLRENENDEYKPILYVNLRNVYELPKFRIASMVYKEILGTYLQLWYESNIEDLPTFRTVLDFSVYQEGWKLYVMNQAVELKMYESPLEYLGHLQTDLLASAKLTMDTGIHGKKWSRETAIQYLVETTGIPQHLAEYEVDKAVVMPTISCLSKIGELKMRDLKRDFTRLSGGKFDAKAFHYLVLRDGRMPIITLFRHVHHLTRKSPSTQKQ